MKLRPLPSASGGGGAEGAGAAGAAPDIRIVEPLCSVFRRKLKSEGLKYTPERAQILDEIIRRDLRADRGGETGVQENGEERSGEGGGGGVFEAEELLASMRRQGYRVSKATVYRTIKLLAEAGIIQQVLFDSEQAHYQLAYGRRSGGLLIDVETRRIIPVEIPELAAIRDRLCREHGLEPEGHRLVIYGRGRPAER